MVNHFNVGIGVPGTPSEVYCASLLDLHFYVFG